MAAGNASLHVPCDRLLGEHLGEARERIVGLVAVHVNTEVASLRALHQQPDALDPRLPGALVVGDPADNVDAHVQRLVQQPDRVREAQQSVLGKRHELDVEQPAELLAQLDQRAHPEQPRVAGVHVAAQKQRALRHAPAQILTRTLLHPLLREQRLQLSPERDAFKQRA